jgi:Fe-S-cluster containining protein
MDEQVWYQEGLRFKCTQCGDCCTGDPGFVWVNKEEIARLAARFELDVDEFEARYVRHVGIRKSLRERENGDCVFFDNHTRKCTVYEDRPRQCRTWPFWASNVRSREAWEQTCQVCPGSGKGRLYPLNEIDAQLAIIHI